MSPSIRDALLVTDGAVLTWAIVMILATRYWVGSALFCVHIVLGVATQQDRTKVGSP